MGDGGGGGGGGAGQHTFTHGNLKYSKSPHMKFVILNLVFKRPAFPFEEARSTLIYNITHLNLHTSSVTSATATE